MAQYHQLSQKDVNRIAESYQLDVLHTEPVSGGNSNTNQLWHTPTGRFLLTIFDDKTKEEVDIIARLLQLLEQYKFPTTRLRPTRNGRLIHEIADKPILVKEFISGQLIDDLTDAMLKQTGAVMAQLHSIPPPDFLPTMNPYSYLLFPQVIGHQIDTAFETWLAARYTYFQQHIPADLPQSIIHADLFTDNILFENGQLKAVIDFEDGCHYFRAFDLGMAVVGLCRQGERISLDKGRVFLTGYQQVQTLAEAEKQYIPFFVNYAATVTSYWRFWKYHVYKSIPENAGKHWQMAKLADSVTAVPASRFIEHLFS